MNDNMIIEHEVASRSEFYQADSGLSKTNSFSDMLGMLIRSGEVDSAEHKVWGMKFVNPIMFEKMKLH